MRYLPGDLVIIPKNTLIYPIINNEMVFIDTRSCYKQRKYEYTKQQFIALVICHGKRLKWDEHYKSKWVVCIQGSLYACTSVYSSNTAELMRQSRRWIRGDYT